MARTKIMVQYDSSNQSCYVFVPHIHFYDVNEDVTHWMELWHTVYGSLGAAQTFFSHWITGDWRNEENVWVADLRTDFPGGGYKVTIEQALIREKP